MRFGFDERTRELLMGIRLHGTLSGAAARIGMDVANAARHLRTAERRAGVPLVHARRGGRGGSNTKLAPGAQRILSPRGNLGFARAFDPIEGVTAIHIGGRVLYAAGAVPAGPVELWVPPESVALERTPSPSVRSSVRNRFVARVEGIDQVAEGVFEIRLSAGAIQFESRIVRGALQDLRLRPGSRVYAVLKAVSVTAALHPAAASTR